MNHVTEFSVISRTFVVEPNTNSVKNVAAFMYGNGVPVEKAVDCFIVCIELCSYYVSCDSKKQCGQR